jgi:hypothetical protein
MLTLITNNTGKSNFTKQGYLTNMFTNLLNGKKVDKLENHHLTHIATVLGEISRSYDLYSKLFEMENEEMMLGNTNINTKDLAAFVLMDHVFTRGYFSKSAAGKATSDTTNSQGVPLALEGAKRLYNKKYSSWIPKSTDRKDLWRCDVFLPADLASFHIDDTGEVKQNELYGILNYYFNKIEILPEKIIEWRAIIPGWESKHHPPKMKGQIDTWDKIYNSTAPKVRAMLLRGWIWQEACRNSDMICDPLNWDDFPKAIQFDGLKPIGGPNPYLEFLK